MQQLDYHKFVARGAFDCGNSDYLFQTTTCCHRAVVRDVELDDIYYDPTDLRKRIRGWERSERSCPLCDAITWSVVNWYSEASVPEEWRWAAVEQLPQDPVPQ